MSRWDSDDPYRERLSTAAAQYRHDGEPMAALTLEMVVHKLDHGRPVRVVDLDAAETLAAAKLGEVADAAP